MKFNFATFSLRHCVCHVLTRLCGMAVILYLYIDFYNTNDDVRRHHQNDVFSIATGLQELKNCLGFARSNARSWLRTTLNVTHLQGLDAYGLPNLFMYLFLYIEICYLELCSSMTSPFLCLASLYGCRRMQ